MDSTEYSIFISSLGKHMLIFIHVFSVSLMDESQWTMNGMECCHSWGHATNKPACKWLSDQITHAHTLNNKWRIKHHHSLLQCELKAPYNHCKHHQCFSTDYIGAVCVNEADGCMTDSIVLEMDQLLVLTRLMSLLYVVHREKR